MIVQLRLQGEAAPPEFVILELQGELKPQAGFTLTAQALGTMTFRGVSRAGSCGGRLANLNAPAEHPSAGDWEPRGGRQSRDHEAAHGSVSKVRGRGGERLHGGSCGRVGRRRGGARPVLARGRCNRSEAHSVQQTPQTDHHQGWNVLKTPLCEMSISRHTDHAWANL
jgi:hypothetical protein